MTFFTNLKELDQKEPVAGFKARFVHTEHMTLAYWDIQAGAVLPEHAHVHEQVTTMLEGQFELTVNAEPKSLGLNDIVIIPSNVRHKGRALTDCRILDVFYPVRTDYQ